MVTINYRMSLENYYKQINNSDLANNNGSMFRGTKWDALNNKYKNDSSTYMKLIML